MCDKNHGLLTLTWLSGIIAQECEGSQCLGCGISAREWSRHPLNFLRRNSKFTRPQRSGDPSMCKLTELTFCITRREMGGQDCAHRHLVAGMPKAGGMWTYLKIGQTVRVTELATRARLNVMRARMITRSGALRQEGNTRRQPCGGSPATPDRDAE